MHVQLNEIDVTPLDELTRIKSELETLDGVENVRVTHDRQYLIIESQG